MTFNNNNVYYVKFNQDYDILKVNQKEKLNLLLNNSLYFDLLSKSDYNYMILEHDKVVGFFSFVMRKKIIKISMIYICKDYRNRGIATDVIKDVILSVKRNSLCEMNYVLVNSFVESALFFLKKGFDLCKVNKKLDFRKKNVIILYKKI